LEGIVSTVFDQFGGDLLAKGLAELLGEGGTGLDKILTI
jgi:hypothetical protein